MRWQDALLRTISTAYSLRHVANNEESGLRILMYHSVGGKAYGDSAGLNSISVDLFRQHISVLKALRVESLLPLSIPGEGVAVSITFDDGYADNLHVAAPLLVEEGLPFTVFVATDFVKNGFAGFLTPEALRELAGYPGVTIGSHGQSHSALTQCIEQELYEELYGSKCYLEDLIGTEVCSVSYPYGLADRRVRDSAQRVGYTVGACSRFDINRMNRDAMMLNRSVILHKDTAHVLSQKLRGDWDWYRWRSPDPLSK